MPTLPSSLRVLVIEDDAASRQAIAEAVRKEPLFISETHGRKEPTIAELEKLDLS